MYQHSLLADIICMVVFDLKVIYFDRLIQRDSIYIIYRCGVPALQSDFVSCCQVFCTYKAFTFNIERSLRSLLRRLRLLRCPFCQADHYVLRAKGQRMLIQSLSIGVFVSYCAEYNMNTLHILILIKLILLFLDRILPFS